MAILAILSKILIIVGNLVAIISIVKFRLIKGSGEKKVLFFNGRAIKTKGGGKGPAIKEKKYFFETFFSYGQSSDGH